MGEWDDYLKQYLTAEATHSDGKSRLAVAAALGARDQGGVFYAASGTFFFRHIIIIISWKV
jgi:hypothetical protein